MANGMGALWVGTSGIQSSQNALNVTANNLANVDTTGYVRQQTIFGDKKYITTDVPASISKQTAGIGVSISDVLHNRDVFLDQSYRAESGREEFYSTLYNVAGELETLFQEMDGESFQEILSSDDNSLWVAFQEFSKDPSSPVNQSLIMQKASLFVTDAQDIYADMNKYQSQLSDQMKEIIERINEIGNEINELNHKIQTIEAAGVETASDMRDARDLLLDELGNLVKISYAEDPHGIVSVSIEGVEFVTEAQVFEMSYTTERDYTGENKADSRTSEYSSSLYTNYFTEQIVPIWPHLGDQSVFHYSQTISSEYNNDVGELKALYFGRGNSSANYSALYDISTDEYVNVDKYDSYVGSSVVMNVMSEFDWLVHSVVTSINDLLCPNTTTAEISGSTATYNDGNGDQLYSFTTATVAKADANGNATTDDTKWAYNEVSGDMYYVLDTTGATEFTFTDPDDPSNTYTYYIGDDGASYRKLTNGMFLQTGYTTRFLDTVTTSVGSDMKLPPQELFSRTGYDSRYTELTYTDENGETQTIWMYNEEDPTTIYKYGKEAPGDSSTMYSIKNLNVNSALKENSSLIPYLTYATEEINYAMGDAISTIWATSTIKLNPEDTGLKTFAEYYEQLIGELGTEGNVYKSTSENLQATVAELESRRQSVIGVSSDEELTSMIRFQNAYNASSRYFNVVSEMLEHLITQLG